MASCSSGDVLARVVDDQDVAAEMPAKIRDIGEEHAQIFTKVLVTDAK
ncbi:hypothetical protein D516_3605 [Rhodobacter sp. AKP1]|nr:hypothetical protein D516_3605 [Rhodobacter sp. AKP1]